MPPTRRTGKYPQLPRCGVPGCKNMRHSDGKCYEHSGNFSRDWERNRDQRENEKIRRNLGLTSDDD